MESLLDEHQRASQKVNLNKSILDLQTTIDMLTTARNSISAVPSSAPLTLAKLQNSIKTSLHDVNSDLKDVYYSLNKYSKALDKTFKDKPLPTSDYDALSLQSGLISRAIGMHFLREGQFPVASMFLSESMDTLTNSSAKLEKLSSNNHLAKGSDLGATSSAGLRKRFGEMYHILGQMKTLRNLSPATEWAREHSMELEARGSNLEFELGKLQFLWLFKTGLEENKSLQFRQNAALNYARLHFNNFQNRHLREIQQLVGAMAFCPNLLKSPYSHFFDNDDAWGNLAMTFTREFCSLLGLSAESPVYVAATAGAIALPTLQKLQLIMETKRTEWTSQNELPVEIPLPPAYHFHSIFVCPVSKEQTTDENPPMMMPCGHVIAYESLQRLSKGGRFKCPYCPGESQAREAIKVFL